jgi:hypothetical protein
MVGRPSSLTPAVLKQAKECLAECPLLCILAGRLGVTYRTVCNWQRAGRLEAERRDRSGYQPLDKFDNHVQIFHAIKRAQADWQLALMAAIKADPQGWQRYAWLLERCFPEHYSNNRLELRELRRELADLRKAIQPA